MKKTEILILVLIFTTFMVSCSSNKEVLKKPASKYLGTTLSKGVNDKGPVCIPREPATTFNTRDKEVTAVLKFENLSGKHKLRWDWYDPEGKLYYSTKDFVFQTSRKKFVETATPWHTLAIDGDKAAKQPGKWEVKIYFDNELLETKYFVLNEYKDSLQLSEGMIAKPFPKDWGLIIGIENYAHLPAVDYAKKDALIMKDYFMKVFGVPEENIITLIDGDATKSRIEGFLKQYIPANVEKSTTLYVYFAGHGAPDMKKGDPFIIPFDGDTRFLEQTGYRLKQLYKDLDGLEIQRSYVFLDSCFSGVASRAAEMLIKGARPALLHTREVKLKTDKVVSISASSKGQMSNAYPETEHGLFTYYLLRALGGEADSDDDNWVSVKEVYNYVKKNVTRVSRRMGAEQVPAITPSLDKLKDVSIGRAVK